MLINRGRYLRFYNRNEEAAKAFKDALALDPKLKSARNGLNDSTEELRNSRSSLP